MKLSIHLFAWVCNIEYRTVLAICPSIFEFFFCSFGMKLFCVLIFLIFGRGRLTIREVKFQVHFGKYEYILIQISLENFTEDFVKGPFNNESRSAVISLWRKAICHCLSQVYISYNDDFHNNLWIINNGICIAKWKWDLPFRMLLKISQYGFR